MPGTSIRLPSVFEPLDQAADAVIKESGRGGIHLKVQVLASLADGLGYVGNAAGVMVSDLADTGYGPEVSEPVWRAREAISLAARMCSEAETAVRRLLNTSLGDLAFSGQQVPHQPELNGGH